MKKIKLNTAKLQLTKEKIANLTVNEMYQLQGGNASGQTPCMSIAPCETKVTDMPCTMATCHTACSPCPPTASASCDYTCNICSPVLCTATCP